MSKTPYLAKSEMINLFWGLDQAVTTKGKLIERYTDEHNYETDTVLGVIKQFSQMYDMGNSLRIVRERCERYCFSRVVEYNIPTSDMYTSFYFYNKDKFVTDKEEIIGIVQNLTGIELPKDITQDIVKRPKEVPILFPVPPFREYSQIITDVSDVGKSQDE